MVLSELDINGMTPDEAWAEMVTRRERSSLMRSILFGLPLEPVEREVYESPPEPVEQTEFPRWTAITSVVDRR